MFPRRLTLLLLFMIPFLLGIVTSFPHSKFSQDPADVCPANCATPNLGEFDMWERVRDGAGFFWEEDLGKLYSISCEHCGCNASILVKGRLFNLVGGVNMNTETGIYEGDDPATDLVPPRWQMCAWEPDSGDPADLPGWSAPHTTVKVHDPADPVLVIGTGGYASPGPGKFLECTDEVARGGPDPGPKDACCGTCVGTAVRTGDFPIKRLNGVNNLCSSSTNDFFAGGDGGLNACWLAGLTFLHAFNFNAGPNWVIAPLADDSTFGTRRDPSDGDPAGFGADTNMDQPAWAWNGTDGITLPTAPTTSGDPSQDSTVGTKDDLPWTVALGDSNSVHFCYDEEKASGSRWPLCAATSGGPGPGASQWIGSHTAWIPWLQRTYFTAASYWTQGMGPGPERTSWWQLDNFTNSGDNFSLFGSGPNTGNIAHKIDCDAADGLDWASPDAVANNTIEAHTIVDPCVSQPPGTYTVTAVQERDGYRSNTQEVTGYVVVSTTWTLDTFVASPDNGDDPFTPDDFTLTGSGNCPGDKTHLMYCDQAAQTVDWATNLDGNATNANASHVFDPPCTYTPDGAYVSIARQECAGGPAATTKTEDITSTDPASGLTADICIQNNIRTTACETSLTGPAPLSVWVDGYVNTTHTGLSDVRQRWTDLRYFWDCDSTDVTTHDDYAYGSLSNSCRKHGPVAAFVYETPGTYTMLLRVYDQNTASFSDKTATITVQDPDVFWAAGDTVCVGDGVEPVAGVDGCPTGADVSNSPTTDIPSIVSTEAVTNDNRRIMLDSAGAWTQSGNANFSASGQTAGAKLLTGYNGRPSIACAGGGADHLFRVTNENASDWRVMALDYTGTCGKIVEPSEDGVIGAENFTLHDVTVASAISWINNGGISGTKLGPAATRENDSVNFMFSEMVIAGDYSGGGGLGSFFTGNGVALMGSRLGECNGTCQHTVRNNGNRLIFYDSFAGRHNSAGSGGVTLRLSIDEDSRCDSYSPRPANCGEPQEDVIIVGMDISNCGEGGATSIGGGQLSDEPGAGKMVKRLYIARSIINPEPVGSETCREGFYLPSTEDHDQILVEGNMANMFDSAAGYNWPIYLGNLVSGGFAYAVGNACYNPETGSGSQVDCVKGAWSRSHNNVLWAPNWTGPISAQEGTVNTHCADNGTGSCSSRQTLTACPFANCNAIQADMSRADFQSVALGPLLGNGADTAPGSRYGSCLEAEGRNTPPDLGCEDSGPAISW